jgi:hypothetical protein
MGITREEVRRARRIVAIASKVKARVRELGLDDNQLALLEIAEMSEADDQARIVEDIVKRKRAESALRVERPANKKDADKARDLHAEIRQDQAQLLSKRKRLKLIEDKLALRDELPAFADDAPTAPLSPDDDAQVNAIITALDEVPLLKLKLAKASSVVLDRVIAIIQSS